MTNDNEEAPMSATDSSGGYVTGGCVVCGEHAVGGWGGDPLCQEHYDDRKDEAMAERKKMVCPRRDEGPLGLPRAVPADAQDEFRVRPMRAGDEGMLGYGRAVCSYCGSLDPDEVMQGLEAGTLFIQGTDKGYKAYVAVVVPAEEQQARLAEWEERMGTPPPPYVLRGNAYRTVGKFYYRHLSEQQQRRFVQIMIEDRRGNRPVEDWRVDADARPYFVRFGPAAADA